MRILGLVVFVLSLAACTPQDKRETRQELRKTGVAVKKELRNDAAFVKEQALKARAETQKGVKKLKKDLNDEPSDQPRPAEPSPDRQ